MTGSGWLSAISYQLSAIGLRRPSPASRLGAPSGSSDSSSDDILLEERTLARLRRLSLLSGRARTEGLAGEHRSRRRGHSPEFADFKPYSQGDDFRRIDWNTYARLDGLFVRLSEVTTELSVHILVDASASMDWRSDEHRLTKFTAARRLAGALAYIALWRFDRVAIVPFAETLGRQFGPTQGRAQVVPALRYLQTLPTTGGTALVPAIAAYAFARSRPGLLLLISDFLSGEPDELQVVLHDLRARGWQTAALHIVDDAEVAPEAASHWLRRVEEGLAASSLELIDRETNATLRLAPDDDVVQRYATAVTTWLEALEAACAAEETAYARFSTAWDIDDLTVSLLYERGLVA